MNYLIADKSLVLQTENFNELLISLKKIRLACPCAHCKGEKDIFGNIYKLDLDHPLLEKSFEVKKIKPIGNYGIKIFWEDNHSNGIYTFDFLKKLSE